GVDRQLGGAPDAGSDQEQCEEEDEYPVLDREPEDAVDHGLCFSSSSSPSSPLMACALTRKAFRVTMRSPGLRPERISTRSPRCAPTSTGRDWNSPGLSAGVKTTLLPSSC